MRSLCVLIFALSMIACGDSDLRSENQSSNPLYPSGPEQVQRGQIVTGESSAVSEAEVVIIDAERLVVLARAPVDDQGGFVVSVPQRPSYWLGVSSPYMTTHVDTAFAFTGEAITVDEPPRSHAAGKVAQVVGILGDVNNDNQVDIADALLVLLYTLERFSFVAPNQGNIALGDVNGDSQIDIADVLLIMTYVANPLDPMLPDGIGLATEKTTVAVAVEQDRAVLIALYEATGGNNWYDNANWLSSTYPLAQWYGVETDDEGRVARLGLSYNDLTGVIPDALGNLNNLQVLNLNDNDLTGSIPEALGNLNNLQVLNLSYNDLTGSIPEALGNLNNLQVLNLGHNDLTGSIPEALGQLDNLDTLYLARNELTGTIPETLGQLDSLKILSLSGNELTGPIPEALGNLNNLQYLGLDQNQLTGAIPAVLGQLENLKILYLYYNQLTGTIPETLGNLNNLQDLYLGYNQLTGPIPEALGQLNNLQYLDLWGNQLTGCIPLALYAMPNNDLHLLGLYSCHISLGEDPQVAALVALYESTGGDNWDDNTKWLSGRPLSEWFGVETDENGRITSLNLYANGLMGPIPEALGQLENLQYLRLNYNQLTGTIPETLGQLDSLKILSLSGNELTGPIPETLGNLNNLQYLYLDDNQLAGQIPEALGQLENLQYLYLKGNELTGCIPSALRAIPNNDLRHLRLDFCQ